MRKSNNRLHRYRPGTSTARGSVTTFRQQMADYAKGQVLRELRKQTGMSREKVAAEIGVTTKTLYSWENDGGIMRENAEKLAAFYKVSSPDSLITRESEGGDQLDRIEAKLDMIAAHLGLDASGIGGAAIVTLNAPASDRQTRPADLDEALSEEDRLRREEHDDEDQDEGREQHG